MTDAEARQALAASLRRGHPVGGLLRPELSLQRPCDGGGDVGAGFDLRLRPAWQRFRNAYGRARSCGVSVPEALRHAWRMGRLA